MSQKDNRLYVIEDDREQTPWSSYWKPEDVIISRQRLVTGDYTLAEMSDFGVCIERKSLADLVQSCIHEWMLFRKKLYRMAAFDMAIVVVESTVEKLLRHEYESEANPNSVMGRVHTITLDHGVPVCWWSNAEIAARQALQWFRLAKGRMSRR